MFDDYEWFKSKILAITGIDLNSYKERQMKRRIDTLITKSELNNYQDYVKLISTDPVALRKFKNHITINVSEFFRNIDQWDNLENIILPQILKSGNGRYKIWSAACSTGDEPYTIAMILNQHLKPSQYELIATDIDDEVLEKAQNGLYNKKSIAGVPQKFRKYFTELSDSTYQISNEIARCVKFKKHNLLSDTYPTNCDLIVCRNVLIYFTDEAKNEIFKKYSDSLRKNGVLFIGNTEQILNPKDYGFISTKSFFYIKE